MRMSPTVVTLVHGKENIGLNIVKKQIQKNMLFGNMLPQAKQECFIQSLFKHENIVELYDYFDNPEDITLLMEWCNDADYFEKKIEQKHTKIKNEEKLRSYSMDILTGLEYIHKSNIIHADMKLPNILMQRPSKEEKEAGELPIVKICDFGVS